MVKVQKVTELRAFTVVLVRVFRILPRQQQQRVFRIRIMDVVGEVVLVRVFWVLPRQQQQRVFRIRIMMWLER